MKEIYEIVSISSLCNIPFSILQGEPLPKFSFFSNT